MDTSLAGGKHTRGAPGTAAEGGMVGLVHHKITYATEKERETPRSMGLQTRFHSSNTCGYATTEDYGHHSTDDNQVAQLDHGIGTSANHQTIIPLPANAIHVASAGHV
jgi:hypothetical protein